MIHNRIVARVRGRSLAVIGGLALGALALGQPAWAEPKGEPIKVGSTLPLTGPLAATGLIHKIAGEIFVEEINKKNGMLGRPVQWILLDDQSKPDLARTLYEKLITIDKVDLVLGPYATGAILSAMAVAERHNRVLVHHTFGIPKLAKYANQFPTWPSGPVPEETTPAMLYDALASTGKQIKTVAFVTSKFPSVHFMSLGAREVAKKRGMTEALYLEFEFGTKDFGALAARVREANADLLWIGSVGVEGNLLLDALKKLGHSPKNHFHLYPAPGPLALSPDGKNALSVAIFEGQKPFTDDPATAAFVAAYLERAKKAGLPYTEADTQAGVSYGAWQIIATAVEATKSTDDKKIADWLRANTVTTIVGKLRFNAANNYGDDLGKIKQVQNGKWVVVWPKQFVQPGVNVIVQ
ncbi:MAG: amino acid ABC transporter substrate-binding protein [Alphaproteobacteria bacterium]